MTLLAENLDRIPYRQSLRQYHALLGAHSALVVMTELSGLAENSRKRPSILVLEEGYPGTLYGVDAYLEYRRARYRPPEAAVVSGGGLAQTTEHYLGHRVRLLLAAYQDRGWEEGQRLVSTIYNVGNRGVNLLIVMRVIGANFEWAAMQEALRAPGKNKELCTVPYCIASIINSGS